MSSPSFFIRYQFWLLLISAIVISRLPIISIPFNWLETFFHELSHGLAAILTGGKIINIRLHLNGAGLCTTSGGNSFIISFMGYAGATFWGASIYLMAKLNQKRSKILTLLLMLLVAVTIILWVRDLLTLVITLLLLTLFYFKWRLQSYYLQILLKLTGILVLLNAVLSPLHLFDGRHIGDGANLANLTGIPEIIWALSWSVIGVVTLYKIGKRQ